MDRYRSRILDTIRPPRRADVVFDNFFLDMNGIVHQAQQTVRGYGNAAKAGPKVDLGLPESEINRAVFKQMEEYINTLMKVVAPRKRLIIALDGIPPRAKQQQQRKRRFRAVCSQPDVVKKPSFDTNTITVGTSFMDDLSDAINAYITRSQMRVHPGFEFVFSDSNVPGEGEHKIAEMIRSQYSNDSNVIYGLDADLVLIGLLAPSTNTYLLREDVWAPHGAPLQFHLVYINELRQELFRDLGRSGGGRVAPPKASVPRVSREVWDKSHSSDLSEFLPVSQVGRGIPPFDPDSPPRAVERNRRVRQLKSVFLRQCDLLNIRQIQPRLSLPMAFTRWLVDQDRSSPGSDALIPVRPQFGQLRKELQKGGVLSDTDLRPLESALTRECEAATATLRAIPGSWYGHENVSMSIVDGERVMVSYGETKYDLLRTHFEKLRMLFERTDAQAELLPASLFCLLARYTVLDDVGFQAALPEAVFDSLVQDFGVKMECFASPLNSRFSRFCSAFPDTDAPFGSFGSFYAFRPTHGSFEVNPPFTEPALLRAAQHIEALLATATAATEALSFVVFMPAWTDSVAWRTMRTSPHLQRFFAVLQTEHCYVVGDQHRASRRYLPATFNTGVFVLQTPRALAMWPPTDEAVQRLHSAFGAVEGVFTAEECERRDRKLREKQERDVAAGWGREDTALTEYVSPRVPRVDSTTVARQIFQDFVVMMNFIGNDFVPHQPVLQDMANSLPAMFDAYIEANVRLYDSNARRISYDGVVAFLNAFLPRYESVCANEVYNDYTYPHHTLMDATAVVLDPRRPGTVDYALAFDVYQTLLDRLDAEENGGKSSIGNYIRMMDWVCTYYFYGVSDWKTVYGKNHPPSLTQVRNYCMTMQSRYRPKRTRIPSLESTVMYIMPAHSIPLVKPGLVVPEAEWMTRSGCRLEIEGTNVDWMGHAVIDMPSKQDLKQLEKIVALRHI